MATNFLSWLTPRPFEPELESLYQTDLRIRAFKIVKLSLLIGTIFFLSLSLIDLSEPTLWPRLGIRIPVAVMIFALWFFIHKQPERATPLIFRLAFMGAATAVMAHLGIMLFAGAAFDRTFPSLMFIIAFVYGPLFVPIIPATLLCLGYIAATLLIYHASIDVVTGIDATFLLGLMVVVSLFSRYQLEVYSRRAFLDRRTADLARAEADEKRRQAEQANLEKAIFLRNTSHNLRQPTQALSSYTLLLEKALQNQDLRSANEVTRNLIYAVDLLAEAFDKILDISRIDRDDYMPVTTPIVMSELLENIRRQYEQQASHKGIRLKVVPRGKPPRGVHSDMHMLQQVISNLVDNAIKYTKQGWVLVRTSKSKNGLRLHVVDSGIGMSSEHGQSIFQPFYRISEQGNETGMGIGLSYVEKTIRKLPAHRLGYYSRLGRGSHFYIDIPVCQENEPPSDRREHVDVALDPGKFILLVDDNRLVLDALEKQLVALGCVVEKALSIVEVQQIMRDSFRPFDLVITDYKLGGSETAETIVGCVRDAGGDVPVIVLTGERFDGQTICLLGKEYPLLRKPVNSSQLARSIARELSATSREIT